ncbi:MAG: hypothetical protein AAB834_07780 [Patescibacteria group bacterium]
MPEGLTAPHPVNTLVDAHMAGAHLADQTELLSAERIIPAQAYEVGHSALSGAVVVETAVEVRVRPPEARAAEIAAGTWRSFSPFREENAPMFGSPEARQEAVEVVRGIADQSRLTGKYFNSQHRFAAQRLAAGEITKDQHDELVGEIATVLAFTKPAHLRIVSEAQRASIDRRKNAGQLPEDTAFVDVTSRITEAVVQLAGIDTVVARMTGAHSQAELARHGLDLKQRTYNEEAFAKAAARHEKQQAELQARIAAVQQEAMIRRHMELLDEEHRLLLEREADSKKAEAKKVKNKRTV